MSIPLAGDEKSDSLLLEGSKGVRSEQPKPRESRSKQSSKGQATPGGAVPFNNKAKGKKDKDPVAPVGEKIRRNGGNKTKEAKEQDEKLNSKSGGIEQRSNLSEDDWPSQVYLMCNFIENLHRFKRKNVAI